MISRRSYLGILGSSLGAGLIGGCVGIKGGAVGDPMFRNDLTFEPNDPRFDEVVDGRQQARLISAGHQWTEGPAWDAKRQSLYFSDVPKNLAFRWTSTDGTAIFLDPSGALPSQTQGMREPGSNGLLMSSDGRLIVCNHGTRSVEKLDLESGHRETLVERYAGRRLSSPNDVAEASDGTLYFTDPPYGLKDLDASPLKEQAANGVFKLSPDGSIIRLLSSMTFPNGIALSPDQKYLYVSQSDSDAPLVRRVKLAKLDRDHKVGDVEDSAEENATVWFDARPYTRGHDGLPDGMAIAQSGEVFLAGPGGVLILDSQGKFLGRINAGKATANCAFGEDGSTLFITAGDTVYAIRTKCRGVGKF